MAFITKVALITADTRKTHDMYSLDFTMAGYFLSHDSSSSSFRVGAASNCRVSGWTELLLSSNQRLFPLCATDQSMRRTEGKRSFSLLFDLSCHLTWFPRRRCWCLLTVPSALHQFPSSMGCSALPASFWHQAEGLQSLPWSKHREREVAGLLKDEKGRKEGEPPAVGRWVGLLGKSKKIKPWSQFWI